MLSEEVRVASSKVQIAVICSLQYSKHVFYSVNMLQNSQLQGINRE